MIKTLLIITHLILLEVCITALNHLIEFGEEFAYIFETNILALVAYVLALTFITSVVIGIIFVLIVIILTE